MFPSKYYSMCFRFSGITVLLTKQNLDWWHMIFLVVFFLTSFMFRLRYRLLKIKKNVYFLQLIWHIFEKLIIGELGIKKLDRSTKYSLGDKKMYIIEFWLQNNCHARVTPYLADEKQVQKAGKFISLQKTLYGLKLLPY